MNMNNEPAAAMGMAAGKKTIDAMWDDSPIDVSSEANFIWSIANKLRGPYLPEKYSKQLETLNEYKKSLIFEYVTGKKEV